MSDEKIETLVSNLEIANKRLCLLLDVAALPEKDHLAIQEAYNLIKQSIRILSDEEISIEIQKLSEDE